MQKLLPTILTLCLLITPAIASNIFVGLKHEGILASPHINEIKNGPEFPESNFKLLKLPDEYYTAHYRLLFGNYEVHQFVAVELIGVHDESEPNVLSTFYLPDDEMHDGKLEEGIDFLGWIDHQTFKININQT